MPKPVIPSPSPCLARWLPALILAMLCSPALALEQVTLKLRYYHQFQFAGYYAALEKGYFRDAGLDVVLVEGDGMNRQEDEVVQGRYDYGVSGSSLIVKRSQGKPVVVLAVIFQHSPFVMLTPTRSGIQGIHDLAGKRVMIMDQSDELMAYLNREGIPLSSLKQLPHSFDPLDLVRGKVDAMSAFVTNEPEFLDRAGFAYQMYSPRSIGIDFYGDNLFTSEAEIHQHPARVRAMRAAALRGWQYAMSNPDEMVELILNKYSRRNSREHLQFEARQMVPLIQPVLVEVGYMNPGRWRHIADTYADLAMVPRDFPLTDFLYDPTPHADYVWLYRVLIAATCLLVLGTVVHFVRLSRERKAATAALRASEHRLRILSEALPQQIWTADAEGRMDYVNLRVTEYFGRDAQVLLREGLRSMVHPDDFGEVAARWREALRSATPFSMDYRLHRRDGSYRWHMGMALPLRDDDGHVLGWFGSSTDISERKAAEETLRRINELLEQRVAERTTELRQAMEQIVQSQKLASLGTLVAGVSHELNTPIGNIVMMASALADRLAAFAVQAESKNLTRAVLNASVQECREAADIIVRSAHRASDLIESFKRVAVDQASQRRRRFKLAEVVRDVLNAINPTLRRANIEVEVAIGEEIEMDSYPGHLEQIISNLVMNSIKHGFEGLDSGRIAISAVQRGALVELQYQDDGKGIAEELQHKVFEPFYTTKLGQGGSGLGMSIVHNLTHAIFKGRVRLESGAGRGVKLVFQWPAVTPEGGEVAESLM